MKGFTLLEVVIALAILSVSLFVLVDSQSTAVLMTVDAEKMLTGTYLAQEKMSEALLRLESDGFREGDIQEAGDFSDFGETDGMGSAPDFGNTFDGFEWAYAIREVDIQIGDMSSLTDAVSGAADDAGVAPDASTTDDRSITDLGIQPDMISDMLKPYIREVRVSVWWNGEDPDKDEGCEDCVELVTHVINPSGQILAQDNPE